MPDRSFFLSLQAYLDQHSEPEPEHLRALTRETHLKVLYPQMLSGHRVGRLLSLFSHLMRPRRVLEIGTYTGYSCLCLAEGLPADGLIDTIDNNPEREFILRPALRRAGVEAQVKVHYGDAKEILPALPGPYELVFMDADKHHYPQYLELVLPKLSRGGLLIADNVLWDGKVLDPAAEDKATQGIRTFNEAVRHHEQLVPLMLGLRDGLLLCRKK